MRRIASILSPVRLGGFAFAAVLFAAAAGCQNNSSSPLAPPQGQPAKPAEPNVPGVGPIQRPAVPPP
jgi:hypothetical protein